jgi:hypothetical protein
MSAGVETSHAELDLMALQGFLVGSQDLDRPDPLCSTTSTSARPPDGRGDGHEDGGCQGIQDPQGIERADDLYHKQEMWSEGRPSQVIKPSSFSRVASSVTDNFGDRDNLSRGAPEQEKE